MIARDRTTSARRLAAFAAAVLGAAMLVVPAVSGGASGGASPPGDEENPCLGPERGQLLCPDLRIAPPTHMFKERTRNGHLLLHAQNNIRSRGRGPIEVRGIRSGPKEMEVRQRIRRVGGGRLAIETDAELYFYPIPGQYRYWKFHDAASFEIWTLDSEGALKRRVRTGPKVNYCLRDLERTQSSPQSPNHRVYPSCSQDPNRKSIVLGTSVGWSDIYPADYHENYIDITGLRGCYAFVHVADPSQHLFELDEDNNDDRVLIRLPSANKVSSC
ncbi:MAG: lysyl oxidase family protein [Actinomycetota bacterium]